MQTELENKQIERLNRARAAERLKEEEEYKTFKSEYFKNQNYNEEDLSEGDFNDLKESPPKIPKFPGTIFAAAVIKDVLDIIYVFLIFLPVANLAFSILIFILWILSAAFAMIIWLWIFSKSTYIRKHLIKKILRPVIITMIAKLIPVLNAIPFTSLSVYLIYRSERGIVKKIVDALEKIEKYKKFI